MTSTVKDSAKTASDASGGDIDWAATLSEALTLPGRLGSTYCRFYRYSFLNQIRLMQQGVFEPCASFKVWKSLGRTPVKGGGRYILHPKKFTKTDDETGEKVTFIARFSAKRTAFPLSQTVGEDLEWPEFPEWDLEKALGELNITRIPFDMIDGNTQGYSVGRSYALNPVARFPVKTTLHELGHIVCGHTTEADSDGPVCSRGVMEFQAEAVAYLLAHELELCDWDPAESRHYIQNWLGREEVTPTHIQKVFSAVSNILIAGRGSAGATAEIDSEAA